MNQLEQVQAAAARYRETASQREEIRRQQREVGVSVVDTAEQIEARVGRLVETGQVPAAALVAAVKQPVPAKVVFERIIDEHNELQPVTFLTRGAEVARTVGRISRERDGRLVPFGTGFLVAPHLLLTNNHVLSSAARAAGSVIEFDCDPGRDPSETVLVRPDPERLFLTDEHLDFTLLAVQSLADGRAPGIEFGWNQLISRQGKIVTGEPVNIIGHPMGRTKEVAIRNNRLSNQLDDFLHYATDTEPGNSGSPVFNDTWELVALHHAGVPETDDDGNVLNRDGRVWQRIEGDDAIRWIANEGTRVSVLLARLASLDLAEEQRALLAEVSDPLLAGSRLGSARTVSPPTEVVADASLRSLEQEDAPRARSDRASGVPAVATPYGGAVHLVFVHGRSQQGRDPALLRRNWSAGLARGLVRAGLPPIEPANVWFPFYGDTLASSVSARESFQVLDPSAPTAEALAPEGDTARSLYASLLEEAAATAGMPANGDADNVDPVAAAESAFAGWAVGRLQRQLTWLANRSGLDDVVIARVFRDVAMYLDRQEVRDGVLEAVLATVPRSGPTVLVCHSLGTVVGMDLLTRLADEVNVTTLVTAGSPLGMDAVYKRLRLGGPHLPERVGSWLNVWCAADAVSIGCPLTTSWGSRVVEVVADNPKERAHDIEEYLADARVARAIGRGLRPG
jgi:endonuclease G, mitochondrial